MANINLLPDDLRAKEEAEIKRAAKQPRIEEIELSNVAKEKPIKTSDKPKESWWQEALSAKKTELPQNQPSLPLSRPSVSSDLLKAAQRQKIKFSQAPKIKKEPMQIKPAKKKIFWPHFERRAKPAPATISEKKPVVFPIISLPPKPVIKREIIEKEAAKPAPLPPQPKPPKAKGVGWWQKLKLNFKKPPQDSEVKLDLKDVKIKLKPPITNIHYKFRTIKPQKNMPEKQSISQPPKPVKPQAKYHVVEEAGSLPGGVNLMPGLEGENQYLTKSQQTLGLILAILAPVVILVGGYFLLGYQKTVVQQKIASQENILKSLEAELKVQRDKQNKNVYLANKLLAIKNLLTQHIYWSKFFERLEKYTLDKVYYTNFAADTKGEISLPGIARGATIAEQYQTLAEQLEALRAAKDFIKDVRVGNLSLQSNKDQGILGIAFELKITLADGVFRK